MCKVTEIIVNGKKVRVANIKSKYMQNIADAAAVCDYIDKIVLFGSSTKSTCRAASDIDLAVFGNQSKGKTLTSAEYRRFLEKLSSFDEYKQTYDVLYFKTGEKNKSLIMNDIEKGEVLYAK